MTMFEDAPKAVVKEGEEETVVPAPPAYKPLKDNNDYGHSDNEESYQKRLKGRKSTKEAEEKTPFYDSDQTDDLTKDHVNKKYGKTRGK